jgi:hypothetical protein
VTDSQLRPPSGESPPTTVSIGEGGRFQLKPLAKEICRRYQVEFPDEQGRYGDAGKAWCVHDNQYLLHWAAESLDGFVDLHREVDWLAGVLESRNFPLARLARNLELAADVAGERVAGGAGAALSAVLVEAAAFVRSRATFTD